MMRPFDALAACSLGLLFAFSGWAQEGKPNPGAAPGAPPQQPTNHPTAPDSGAAHNPDQIPQPNRDDQLQNPLQKNSVPATAEQGTTSRDSSRFPDQTEDVSTANQPNHGAAARKSSSSTVGPSRNKTTRRRTDHKKRAAKTKPTRAEPNEHRLASHR